MRKLIAGLLFALVVICRPGAVAAQGCESVRAESMSVSDWNSNYKPHRVAAERASKKGQNSAECDHYLEAAANTELTWVAAAMTRNAAHALLKGAQTNGISAANSKALLKQCLSLYDDALKLLDVADCVKKAPESRSKTRVDIGKGSRWARHLLSRL